jgi:hypothetical protein
MPELLERRMNCEKVERRQCRTCGGPVHEGMGKGVWREWWSVAGFCMFQRREWVSQGIEEGMDMLSRGRRVVTERAGVCGLGGYVIVLQD